MKQRKKKKSGWTLKPGESVQDWRDSKRLAWLAEMSEQDWSRVLLMDMGYDDDMDDDDD